MVLNIDNVPNLISFFGVDGSGKTTQVILLSKILEREGMKFKQVWIRSPHGFAYYMWKLLVKIGFRRCIKNKYGLKLELPCFKPNSYLSRLWVWFELFNVIPAVFLKALLPAKMGYLLLAERYTPDSIATIAYFVLDSNMLNSKVS
ncbi:MAG: hypothetical protein ACFFDN_34495, partial [Candidatus Hodarchaeota archaeon]